MDIDVPEMVILFLSPPVNCKGLIENRTIYCGALDVGNGALVKCLRFSEGVFTVGRTDTILIQ